MDKQPNSRYCFLCGVQNPIGLRLAFYDEEQGKVSARFTPHDEHQGYPGVLHGGITSALLDETIGRTLVKLDIWAMTVELNIRFRLPIPIGQELTVMGEMTRLRSKMMEGQGEIRLADGRVAATATARYIRLAENQVDSFRNELGFWEVVPDDEAR